MDVFLQLILLKCVTEDKTLKACKMAMDILSSDLLTSLLKVFQDGCPIEDYVEEFLNISNRVPWKGKNLEDHLLG